MCNNNIDQIKRHNVFMSIWNLFLYVKYFIKLHLIKKGHFSIAECIIEQEEISKEKYYLHNVSNKNLIDKLCIFILDLLFIKFEKIKKGL